MNNNQRKEIKTCNLTGLIASKLFVMLNPSVRLLKISVAKYIIVTDVEPGELIFPEGWYYAKGTFRNKHNSSGIYYEVPMYTTSGVSWGELVNYCNRFA